MKTTDIEVSTNGTKKLSCFLADSDALIKEAQALRYRVFAKEMGAKLQEMKQVWFTNGYEPTKEDLIAMI